MLAPHGLAGTLRLPGAVPVGELKEMKKEMKKREKRMTLTTKDLEKRKEKEEKEHQKKEKEAEREREKKEKEERKRKEKEEKEALKAKEREERESNRLTASLPTSGASASCTGGSSLCASDPASAGTKGKDSSSSKRRTMLFGKLSKGGPGTGEQTVRLNQIPDMSAGCQS